MGAVITLESQANDLQHQIDQIQAEMRAPLTAPLTVADLLDYEELKHHKALLETRLAGLISRIHHQQRRQHATG